MNAEEEKRTGSEQLAEVTLDRDQKNSTQGFVLRRRKYTLTT